VLTPKAQTMTLTTLLCTAGAALTPVRLGPAGASLPSYNGRPPDDRLQAALGVLPLHAMGRRPAVQSEVWISPENQRGFDVDLLDLTGAKTTHGRRVEKMSWSPWTGELLLVHPPQRHATARGAHAPEDCVRAILLHERRLILLRPVWPLWARRPVDAGFGPEAAAASIDAQLDTAAMLRTRGAAAWDIELNTTNAILEELTGRRGW
jgi:hypothetical protein